MYQRSSYRAKDEGWYDTLGQPWPPSHTLPTMYDLPSEDPEEPGLPDEFHDWQPQFLRETCRPTGEAAIDFFIGADLNLYYDSRHPLWYKRPDWFLVLGVARATQQQELRWSYLIWQEAIAPFLVVELLSPGTEAEDLGQTVREIGKPPGKWEVYERILRIPFYVVFDRYTHQLQVFGLRNGRYEPLELLEGSKIWFEALGLGLGIWQGAYQGIEGIWLRWYDPSGAWVPTEAEARRSAEQQAQAEAEARRSAEQQAQAEAEARRSAEQQAQAEAEARRSAEQQAQAEAEARRLAEQQAQAEAEARRAAIPRLVALGLSMEAIAAALGLSDEEIS